MAIIPRKDLGETQLLQIGASSRFGGGSLCVTDMALAYETDESGLYLNFIPHDIIKSVRPVGQMFGAKKFRITWSEDGADHFFEFRTKHHVQLQKVLRQVGF